MKTSLRRYLTYANVMATIAVLLAASGSAYAAIRVSGANVVNGSLTGADIKNHSLTQAELAKVAKTPMSRLKTTAARGSAETTIKTSGAVSIARHCINTGGGTTAELSLRSTEDGTVLGESPGMGVPTTLAANSPIVLVNPSSSLGQAIQTSDTYFVTTPSGGFWWIIVQGAVASTGTCTTDGIIIQGGLIVQGGTNPAIVVQGG